MRIRGFVLALGVALMQMAALAAEKTPPAAPPPAAAKPPAAKPPAAKAAPGAAKPAARPSARAKAKAPPKVVVIDKKPGPPPVAFVPRIDATIEHGCVERGLVLARAAKLGIPPQDIEQWVAPLTPAAARNCIDYAVAELPVGIGSSLALLEGRSARGAVTVTVLRSQAVGDAEHLRETLSTADWRDLVVPARVLDDEDTEEIKGLTYNLQWEVGVLVRQMRGDTDAPAGQLVRIVLQKPQGEDYEKIVGVELIDSTSGRVLDSVVWLDRPNDIGAYFNLKGENFERAFWESPVDFTRITRGVGRGSVTIKRSVPLKSAGKKTKRFAVRSFRYRGQHVGIDFAAPMGTPVRAVADGEVLFAASRGGYGNLIVLEHGRNYQTYYGHLSRFADGLTAGQKVLRGEEIGFVGSTGMSTGPHLHFEVRKDNQYFDPLARQNNLSLWNLYPAEHSRLLARIIALDVTRPVQRSTQARVGTD